MSMKIFFVCLLIISFLAGTMGCAEWNRTAKGAAIGAGAGGAAGGLIGYATGSPVAGVLIGAGAGVSAGAEVSGLGWVVLIFSRSSISTPAALAFSKSLPACISGSTALSCWPIPSS